MTEHSIDNVRNDIAYLKALAEEGRAAPLLMGPVLVAAALWFGAATLIQFGVALDIVPLHGWGILALWVVAGLGFAGLLYVLIRRIHGQIGSQSRDNIVMGATWSACGYSIFGTWLVLIAFALGTQNWSSMALMPSFVMVAYGAAWVISGQIAKRGWMLLTGLLCFVGAAGLGYFAFTVWTYAIYLALLMAVALIPGLHLMRLAKQTGA